MSIFSHNNIILCWTEQERIVVGYLLTFKPCKRLVIVRPSFFFYQIILLYFLNKLRTLLFFLIKNKNKKFFLLPIIDSIANESCHDPETLWKVKLDKDWDDGFNFQETQPLKYLPLWWADKDCHPEWSLLTMSPASGIQIKLNLLGNGIPLPIIY
jgi:hypothetical protein